MTSIDPPGFLDDLNTAQKALWSQWISDRIDDCRTGEPQLYDFDAPRPRFFNPLTTAPAADATEKDITWTAFPRVVQLDAATDEERWTIADGSRDVQDEYCEWSVTRGGDGKIQRVTFTSEGPEYWQFLASIDMDMVLELYRTHVGPSVQAADLVDTSGQYNPRNKWNNSTRKGAMHLIQQNNTLSAEIELAAAASNVRVRSGATLTDERDLILCGAYGQPERHSDPTIGAVVNALARAEADITLANPVGLYLGGLNTAGWTAPDGADPASFWSVTRGTPAKAVRAVFEVPPGRGYGVGDLQINGSPVRHGAQIADFITIKLTGLATRIGASVHPPVNGCKRRATGGPGAGLAAPSVESVVNAARRATR